MDRGLHWICEGRWLAGPSTIARRHRSGRRITEMRCRRHALRQIVRRLRLRSIRAAVPVAERTAEVRAVRAGVPVVRMEVLAATVLRDITKKVSLSTQA